MTTEYLPIDAYGAIGNDNRCALVGRNGSVDWCPFPHVESPSVFTAILDSDEGGRFRIEPTDEYDAEQSYVDGTNVLRTRFETDAGTAVVTDFMPVREGEAPDERFQQSLYRKVEVLEGSVELGVEFAPRFDYGRAETTLERTDEGDLLARAGDGHLADGDTDDRAPAGGNEQPDGAQDSEPADVAAEDLDRESDVLYLHGVDLDRVDEADATATKTVTMDAGAVRWFCCQYGAPDHRSTDDYQTILEETIDYWRTWLEGCREGGADLLSFEDEWQEGLTRSALVLKLLIHEETGAIPAAPTTSLPEELGGELNWDYRYNWIRDAKFTVQALYMVGQEREARKYFEWFRDIGHEDPAEIQPLYDLHGGTDIDEEILDHLSGYRDSTPVRIGNAAAGQKQLDIYGTIVQGIYETVRYEDGLTDEDWDSVRALADHVCDHWDEKGESIWEFRDLHEHFVHSKLLCWVALDRALRLAEEYDRDGPFDRWEGERAEIREAIETRGYDEEEGTFRQFFGADEALDATALLIPLYDFLPADDERVLGTIDAVIDELTTDDGLVVRFANSPARPRESGGFVLCGCWLIDALVLAGRVEEAREYFDALLEYASPLGLYSEMIHTDDGSHLGNYPQAFSHIGIINSAIYLASEDEAIRDVLPDDLEAGDVAPLFRQHDG
ncbi:glycoside hydrolase family 15 protein [Halovivax gelatinilyticus]|uniref:glycoside hydrolase family 15 protein n=1 Tax=Halovivax gelatinilyticus TaxID=2961597 RepID=UPI0020CA7774|nr:glycoside hydrolase family 15 protein [Halovivax gelatinilyticus]